MTQGQRGPESGSGPEWHGTGRGAAAVKVAAFQSPETRRLGRAIGMPLAVLTAVKDPEAHAARLSRTWHGAWATREAWFAPFDYEMADPTSCTFAHVPMDRRWMGPATLPTGIELADGCLVTDIPPGTLDAFAAAFGLAMADRRVDAVASRPSRVRYRYATGRTLDVPPRYAGDPSRAYRGREVSLVRDLLWFRPRDLPMVASAASSAASIVALSVALARLGTHPRAAGPKAGSP